MSNILKKIWNYSGEKYVFHSTQESREKGKVSVLAILEVISGVLIYWVVIPYYFGIYTQITLAVVFAFFMLLGSEGSRVEALKLMAKVMEDEKKEVKLYSARGIIAIILTIIISLIVMNLLKCFFIDILNWYYVFSLFLITYITFEFGIGTFLLIIKKFNRVGLGINESVNVYSNDNVSFFLSFLCSIFIFFSYELSFFKLEYFNYFYKIIIFIFNYLLLFFIFIITLLFLLYINKKKQKIKFNKLSEIFKNFNILLIIHSFIIIVFFIYFNIFLNIYHKNKFFNFLIFCGLFFTYFGGNFIFRSFLAMLFKIYGTIKYLFIGLNNFNKSWFYYCFIQDFNNPPEIIPNIEFNNNEDLKYLKFSTFKNEFSIKYKNKLDKIKNCFFLSVSIILISISSVFYRLSIKSTFWFYIPIIIVKKIKDITIKEDRELNDKEFFNRFYNHSLAYIGLIIFLTILCIRIPILNKIINSYGLNLPLIINEMLKEYLLILLLPSILFILLFLLSAFFKTLIPENKKELVPNKEIAFNLNKTEPSIYRKFIRFLSSLFIFFLTSSLMIILFKYISEHGFGSDIYDKVFKDIFKWIDENVINLVTLGGKKNS